MTLASCRSPYGGSFPCLLRLPFLVISSRRPVPVSPRSVACLACRCCLLRPSSRAICLLAVLRPASRLASRPVLPWVMPSPSCPIAPSCRSAYGHRSPRPACRLGWERDGTGLPLSPSPARLAAAACSGMASRLRAFPCCGLLAYVPPFVSVLWRRTCIYDLSRCYNIM